MDSDSGFLNEMAGEFEADGMFDDADRLRAIATRLDEYEAAEKGWQDYAKEHGLPVSTPAP